MGNGWSGPTTALNEFSIPGDEPSGALRIDVSRHGLDSKLPATVRVRVGKLEVAGRRERAEAPVGHDTGDGEGALHADTPRPEPPRPLLRVPGSEAALPRRDVGDANRTARLPADRQPRAHARGVRRLLGVSERRPVVEVAEPKTVPAPAPAARSRLRAGLGAALPIVTVFFWLCLLYGSEAWGNVTPWLNSDEYERAALSRAVASTGHEAWRTVPYGFDSLYVYLIAPAWWLHDTTRAYGVAKAIGVVSMTAVVFPTYLLARMIVSRGWALFAAAGSAMIPALAYSSMLLLAARCLSMGGAVLLPRGEGARHAPPRVDCGRGRGVPDRTTDAVTAPRAHRGRGRGGRALLVHRRGGARCSPKLEPPALDRLHRPHDRRCRYRRHDPRALQPRLVFS